MKFKQLAIASILLMASSAASALYIEVSDIKLINENTQGALQWTTTEASDFGFNLSSISTLVYGTFSTTSFPFAANDNDVFKAKFKLNPPGGPPVKEKGVAYTYAEAVMQYGADDKVTINFNNAWINMGDYSVKFLDAVMDANGNVDLKAEFQIPEPSVLALFGAGLLGLGIVRRRKHKS
jgi:hypothetical protein